jgi:pyridoxal phosphate enzyme (YggS family)
MIETVDSIALAEKLNKSWFKFQSKDENIKVKLQVNTSGEKQKNGADLESVLDIYRHIMLKCKYLDLTGLMTIGSINESINANSDHNKDFKNLVECKDSLVKSLNIDENMIELSMGMSNDFETAVAMGSGSVRIGSKIFGSRN